MEQQTTLTKKDYKLTLRKIIFPMAIVSAILLTIWLILAWICGMTAGTDAWDGFMKALRYYAIAPIILSFPMSGLLIALSVIQFTELNKMVVKDKILLPLINVLIGTLVLSYFFTCISRVFDEGAWWEGTNIAGLGCMLISSVYCIIYILYSDSKKHKVEGGNEIVVKTLGFGMFVSICAISIPMILTVIAGFINDEQVLIEQPTALKFYTAGHLISHFVLAFLSVVALGMFFFIPLAAFKKNNNEIVKWSVIGGINFVLVVVAFALWNNRNYVAGASLMILSYVSSFIGSFFAFKEAKPVEIKVSTPVVPPVESTQN